MTTDEHGSATRRLEAALAEESKSSDRYDAAAGTSSELNAYVRLLAAHDEVAARVAWLNWVDDERFRALDAGPFELLAEQLATKGR